MAMKGFRKFREKTPWFAGKKIIILPLYFIIVLSLSLLVMFLFYSLPELLLSSGNISSASFLFPLAGELIIIVVAFSLVYQMWSQRDRLKARYGDLSYQRIFLCAFSGITLVLSVSIHMFIHYWQFSPQFWMSSPLNWLAIPLETFAGGAATLIFWIRVVLAVFLAITGLMMCIRSLQTFGFDYMTVVYLYFPEESTIQDHQIYSILRHPAYAGALTIALGGLFFTFTVYSIIFFVVYLAAFYNHVHFVEEKELITRFGSSYREYIKRVPAFFIDPRKVGTLFYFLFKLPGADHR